LGVTNEGEHEGLQLGRHQVRGMNENENENENVNGHDYE